MLEESTSFEGWISTLYLKPFYYEEIISYTFNQDGVNMTPMLEESPISVGLGGESKLI